MELPAEQFGTLRDAYEGRRVCVTGGAGFIGSHLVDTLLSAGAEVSIIDDLSNSTLDHIGELIELEPDRCRFVYGSILDDRALEDAVRGCSVVFHLGAMGSVPRSVEQPARSFAVNATGTLRVLQAMRAGGAERIVFAGSSSAYGGEAELPARETAYPCPQSPYAAGKLSAEQLVTSWCRTYGLSGVNLRYFNIFGPRQRSDSAYAAVIAAFIDRVSRDERPVIYGDGTQSRDFTFVANAVLATSLAGIATPDEPLRGQVVNVGMGESTTLLELLEMIIDGCGRTERPEAIFEPARAGDVPHSKADISQARRLLGYEPVTGLREGLAETCAWYERVRAAVP